MLLLSAIRVARFASSSVTLRPATASIRLNSTQTPSTPKAKSPKEVILDRKHDLERDWDTKIIAYEDFLAKTQEPSPGKYIIDVREPDEVIQGMIPSAVNLPLSVLGNALHMHHNEFQEKFGFEKPKVDQEVVFYCRSGMRSTTASDVAKRNGYQNVLNYKGSWLEWTAKQSENATA